MVVRGHAADLVQRSEAAIICEPENEEKIVDAIIRMLRIEREQLNAMGAKGRKFYLDELSLQVGGSRLDSLLRDVCERATRVKRSAGIKSSSV